MSSVHCDPVFEKKLIFLQFSSATRRFFSTFLCFLLFFTREFVVVNHASEAVREGSQEGRQDAEGIKIRRQEAQTQKEGVLFRLYLPCPEAG